MMKFVRKRWYVILAVIAIAGFIFLKIQNSASSADKTNSKYTVKKQTLKETLTLSGEVDADEKVSLRFQTSGRLAWVGVKEGDTVKKYQTVASLDQRDLKNRMQKYLNTFNNQRLTFEQTKDDYWNKQYDLSDTVRKSAERTLQENQNDLNNSVLDVELQNLSLEYANLFSPIDGLVTQVDTPFPGVNVTPAGSELQIVNPKTIYLSVTAEQTEVVELRKGMVGEVVFDAFPDDKYEGTVDYISFAPMSGGTGTVYEVKVLLSEAALDLPLKLAMSGDISFVTRVKEDAIGVPLKFIKKDAKGEYVDDERGGKRFKSYIERGEEIDDVIEIKSGVEVGDVLYD